MPVTSSVDASAPITRKSTSKSWSRNPQKKIITAARLTSEFVRTSLGPCGMDKLILDNLGEVVITNDGATILREADLQNPVSRSIFEVAKAVDDEAGDGTTSAVILIGELLGKAEELLEKGVHPNVIASGYKQAEEKAKSILPSMAIRVNPKDRQWLTKVAKTSMFSKLVFPEVNLLARLAVETILTIAEEQDGKLKVNLDDIKIEKKAGGEIRDSRLIRGVTIKQEIVHSSMPREIEGAKIALLNCQLEMERTKIDAKVTIYNPERIKMFQDEEDKMVGEMAEKVIGTGANVVLNQKAIDDVAQHYFAEAGILAVKGIESGDMEKLARATGGRIASSLEELTPDDFGKARLVEEKRVDEKKWVFVEGCANPKAVTLFLRGGNQKIVEEVERSVHDALCVVRDVMLNPLVVCGAGAPEAEVASKLFEWAKTLRGREQLAALKYAEALEVIPSTLAESAGMDTIKAVSELRVRHSKGEMNTGVNVIARRIEDVQNFKVYEPLFVKEKILAIATEAAMMILRIDDILEIYKPHKVERTPFDEQGDRIVKG